MSHWNHRVMRFDPTPEELEQGGETYFAVREVHYDENGVPYGYSGGDYECMQGDSVESLRVTVERIRLALDKPVLTHSDMKGAPSRGGMGS